MFQYLYEWTQNLAFYMVLVTVVLYTVPDSGYKKYIRFFTGMVLILMVAAPVFRIFGIDSQITNFYKSREYEAKLKEIEEAAGFLKDVDSLGILKEAKEGAEDSLSRQGAGKGGGEQEHITEEADGRKQEDNSISVEEIRIEGENEAD